MSSNFLFFVILFLFGISTFVSCKEGDETDRELTISPDEISFAGEGEDSMITITSGDQWNIGNSASSWLQLSQTSGAGHHSTIGPDRNATEEEEDYV